MVLSRVLVIILIRVVGGYAEVYFGLFVCAILFSRLFSNEFMVEIGGLVRLDLIAVILVMLSFYITGLIFIRRVSVKRFQVFKVVILLICVVLIMAFRFSSMFLFYIRFESVLIPTLLLILGWGYQPERMQAINYILLYTVGGSMPLIYGLRLIYIKGTRRNILRLVNCFDKISLAFCWFYVTAFFVKLPVFPFHLWLPKAHVEAPVSGSIILAGLLLKLGGYGFLRVSICIEFFRFSIPIILVLRVGLFGGVLTRLICLRQCDLKALVAFSSIGHISFVLLGVLRNLRWGVLGGILVMLGHGLCSSGLFSLVNYMYKVRGRRLIRVNKGYLLVSPRLAFVRFALVVRNIASPPSLNLFGELLIFIVVSSFRVFGLILVGLMSFLAACYSLYIYVGSQHGKRVGDSVRTFFVNECGVFVLLIHWLPLNFLFLIIP